MTMPTHPQTAEALDATIRAMETDPRLDADAAARLAIHGDANWQMPYGDTTDSMLYEAVVDAIAHDHAPHLDADERDLAQELSPADGLRAARAASARLHSYS
ncbi:hypothetical protein [Streptomyces sp. Je 1-369]|uniref:hypothetical protein n=1 Tax=Streptomyces sp. Je 1-369 TaxID=2966192 RepID=UPI002285F44F|nr:hypothetical protein [Streptomyces sp. Je 1-369]WAL93978.1 hypothetical protein NOO62_05365 [Streptomyces sp. Je 1-369]